MAIARYANEIGADAIAHGSTGAGNDQIRFDMTFLVLAPGVEIITLTRDMALSRQQEIDYLNKQPIGYVFAGAGIGYIPSVEKVEGLAASNYVTGLDWRVGMSRYYNRWGWGVLVQQFRSKQSVAFYDGGRGCRPA